MKQLKHQKLQTLKPFHLIFGIVSSSLLMFKLAYMTVVQNKKKKQKKLAYMAVTFWEI
jgi:hypothetical protein